MTRIGTMIAHGGRWLLKGWALLAILVCWQSGEFGQTVAPRLAAATGGNSPTTCPRMVFTWGVWQESGGKAWSADQAVSVPATGGDALPIWTTDSGTTIEVTDLSGDCTRIVGSGTRYISAGPEFFLFVANVSQPGATPIVTSTSFEMAGPVWLANNQSIVYLAHYDDSSRSELRVVESDGGNDRPVADLGDRRISNIGAIPGPDGTKVVLSMSDGWEKSVLEDLWLVDIGNGTLTRLTNTPDLDEAMANFSPDGSLIAYVSYRGDWEQDPPAVESWIRLRNLATGEDRVVAEHRQMMWAIDVANFRTLWNRQGTELLALLATDFIGEERLPETALYRIPLNGSGPIEVIRHPGCGIYSPGWTVINNAPAIRYQVLCLDQPVRIFTVRPDGTGNTEVRVSLTGEGILEPNILFHR